MAIDVYESDNDRESLPVGNGENLESGTCSTGLSEAQSIATDKLMSTGGGETHAGASVQFGRRLNLRNLRSW